MKLYIDRLGIRGNIEFHSFVGRSDDPNDQRLTKLDIDFSRIGVDLDLIRYPFLKLGTSTDYYFNPVKFTDRSDTVNTADESTLPKQRALDSWRLRSSHSGPAERCSGYRPCEISVSDAVHEQQYAENYGLGNRRGDTAIHMGYQHVRAQHIFRRDRGRLSFNKFGYECYSSGSLVPLPDLQLKARWQGAFFQVEAFF